MDLAEYQTRIDAVAWYHEFDFPNGLQARAKGPDVAFHHEVWRFISRQLDAIDFQGKSVLDIGCWDGFWSFDAERRGAGSVLATDDATQNWAGSAGLLLAKELLGSSIETKLDVSVYDLDVLDKRFDIILCMGIYYHLVDPFHAFSQIRHRCHEQTIVVFEGDITTGMRPNSVQIDLSDHTYPVFVPTPESLNHLLGAAYFTVVSQTLLRPPSRAAWVERLRYSVNVARGKRAQLPPLMNRAVTVCKPFSGPNPLHNYRAPFGLAAYG